LKHTIYIKDPFNFCDHDWQKVKKLIYTLFPDIRFRYECHTYHHCVHLDGVTMTLARQIALAFKTAHLYKAIQESRPDSRVYAINVDIEIRVPSDPSPVWAVPGYKPLRFFDE
jgi:hypothetical protein